MREIVLDTETTGMDPADGHRIIEIGCVELFNHIPTGNTWHHYINPERDIDAGATRVHGITNDKVKNKPVFAELVGSFIDFIGDAKLVIHNAEFDIKFLNAEMKRLGFPSYRVQDAIDTLLIARRKYPGQPASLDALCRRFNIDLSERSLHGALLDAQLLSVVYLELIGGRQHGLGLGANQTPQDQDNDIFSQTTIIKTSGRPVRPPRDFAVPQEELEAHKTMCSKLKNPLWGNA
jgi:DNA polymerase III subunit epsilon